MCVCVFTCSYICALLYGWVHSLVQKYTETRLIPKCSSQLFSIFFYFKLCYTFKCMFCALCVYVYKNICVISDTWRSEDNLQKLVLSSYSESQELNSGLQVGSRLLYLPSHLTGSYGGFQFCCCWLLPLPPSRQWVSVV